MARVTVLRQQSGRRSPFWARLCVAVGVLLFVIGAGGLISLRMLVHRYESAVSRAELLPPSVIRVDEDPDSIEGPLNILLVGSDYRRGLEDQAWRSDTIMIVHIPKGMDRAYVLSIPRDLRVDIPWCPGAPDGCVDKVNAAFAYGGAGDTFDPIAGYQLLAATVHEVTGVSFDAAAVLDFQGFTKIVGALGGVRLCVDVRTVSIHTGTVWEPGCQNFNEHEALDYLRQRDFPDGDVTRQRHQQQFLKAVLSQAASRGVLTDFAKLDRVVQTAGQSLTVGGPHSTTSLFFALRSIRPESLTLLRLPVTDEWIGGVSYALPVELTEPMFEALQRDELESFIEENPDLINR